MKKRFDAMAFMVGICAIIGIAVVTAIILFGIEFIFKCLGVI